MRPVDANISLDSVVAQDHDVAPRRKRKIILADLEALWKIWIVVVLPVKERLLLNSAVQGKPDLYAKLNSLLVQHRQGTWQPQTNRAGVRIGL